MINLAASCSIFKQHSRDLQLCCSHGKRSSTQKACLFLILLCFPPFLFFAYLQLVFFFFFNSTFSLSWCEMNIKGRVLLVSLQHTRAAQWDVIRTCVTTRQTVINSDCINGSNFSTTPSSSSEGAVEQGGRGKRGKKNLQELATKGLALHMIRLCQNCTNAFYQDTAGIFI